MTEDIIEMIDDAAFGGYILHLQYDGFNWSAQQGDYIANMTEVQLKEYVSELIEALYLFDSQEPRNINSDDYTIWADAHENLEDILDECRERLDEIES